MTKKNKSSAFTLIELMIVVAIVPILASFGLPVVASTSWQTPYGAHANQDYTRKAYVAELITLAGPIQKQVIDNAVNGLPFSRGVKYPTSKYGTSMINDGVGHVDITVTPTYFEGIAYHLDMSLRFVNPATGSATYVTPGVIPDSNLYWICRSAAQGTTTGYPYLPTKWVPESCK